MRIRPATREDFKSFHGYLPDRTAHAWVAVDDEDNYLGMGGYYFQNGVAVAFTDNRANMSKRDMICGARFILDRLKRLGVEIVAVCEPDNNGTALKHFGFEPHIGQTWRLVG